MPANMGVDNSMTRSLVAGGDGLLEFCEVWAKESNDVHKGRMI
jgi:hypothetical protein